MQLKEFTSNPSQATLLCGGERTRLDTSQIMKKDIYIYVYIYKTFFLRGVYVSLSESILRWALLKLTLENCM